MRRLNRVEHRAVERIEPLIAASARARIKNRVGGVAVKIRVTRIDFAEVRQKRNNLSAALVNSVAGSVNFGNFRPGKNVADRSIFHFFWFEKQFLTFPLDTRRRYF